MGPSGRSGLPPVQRVRVTFTKGEPIRFIGHLDVVRLWERAARRARLPLAYTFGFTPHPRLTFAAPLALGATGERELMDAFFTERLELSTLRRALSAQLPPGCSVMDLQEVRLDAPSVMAVVRWSGYRVTVREALRSVDEEPVPAASPQGSRWARGGTEPESGTPEGRPDEGALAILEETNQPWRPASQRAPARLPPAPLPPIAEVQRRIDQLLAASHVPFVRVREEKTSTVDLRPQVVGLWAPDPEAPTTDPSTPTLTLGMLLTAGPSGAGRPEEVTAALGLLAARVHRVHVGLDGQVPTGRPQR